MRITEINPHGFCGGVKRSLQIIKHVIDDPIYPRPLHLLGQLVHNKFINDALRSYGVIIHEGDTRDEMLDEIESGTVIFTAHGVSNHVIKKAHDKNLTIVNATCPYVTKSFDLIKEKIQEGFTVIYVGKNHHPETKAALSIDDSIILVENKDDVDRLTIDTQKIALVNQTTMSPYDIREIMENLVQKYPQTLIYDSICNSTKRRQESLLNVEESVDLIIVVGDPHSHNTKKLVETSRNILNKSTLALENVEGLNGFDLSKYEHIALTAGTSTPKAIINEIVEALNNPTGEYKTKLKNDDYLNVL